MKMKIPKTFVCKICSITFISDIGNACLCSDECRRKAHNKYEINRRNKFTQEQKQNRLNTAKSESKTKYKTGYGTYRGIHRRCDDQQNKSYRFYGALGIKCLLSVEEFLSIYFRTNTCELCLVTLDDSNRGSSPNSRTIDRINPNGNYETGNVRVICRTCNSKIKALPKIDKDILFELYNTYHLTTEQIGIIYGCCANTISKWLKSYDIKVVRQDRKEKAYK